MAFSEYTPAAEASWRVASGENDDLVTQVKYRADLADFSQKNELAHRMTVSWTYDVDEDEETMGLPNTAQLALMREFEAKLTLALEEAMLGVLAFTFTRNGQRDFDYYVGNLELLETLVNKEFEAGLPIQLSIHDDADWAEYEHMLAGVQKSED
ncbi:DUF695 domain-containing protein [Persicirhabdus sediminis]|uniref:DUF695 domain-containing protein n=1 Tax=Persicirhabdus sediminis TaxID=454144 RepID=A0A8J7MD76_9BACT|nr:DUF695 domain-containing protein [Persicirhabdus sediminis]MBK1791031.1 DUF695 domain-containing protein [Persicirhabdus sediminis]